MYKNGHKKAQIRLPDFFPHASILENWSFCFKRTKMGTKRPKSAARFISTHNYLYWKIRVFVKCKKMGTNRPKSAASIYFHAQVYWIIGDFIKRMKIGTKKAQICCPDLFPRRRYEREFLWQFLPISLLRSRGSLQVPRSLAWINTVWQI